MRPMRFVHIQDKKRKQMFVRIFGLCVVAGVILLALGFFLQLKLRVKHVACYLGTDACDQTLLTLATTTLGKSMFANLQVRQSLLQFSLKRQWPDSIRIQFTKPEILVSFTNFSLTPKGLLVPFTQNTQNPLPFKLVDKSLEEKPIGFLVDEKILLFYKQIATGIRPDIAKHIQSVTLSKDESVTLEFDTQSKVMADVDGIDHELLALAKIFPLLADGKEHIIDLRFKNPVLK